MNELTKKINQLRLNNKNKWYYYTGIFEGKTIELKAFGTWLQIYKIDGVNHSGLMDISIKEFKNTLETPFK